MPETAPPRRPILSVSVALWRGDALLLVRRGKPPNAGRWSLPGGAVEFGEPMAAAARRELFEETGVEAEIGTPLRTFEIILDIDGGEADGRAAVHHFVLTVFAARYLGGAPAARDDAAEAAFVPREEARRLDLTAQTRALIEGTVE